jgi:hypothetical protein
MKVIINTNQLPQVATLEAIQTIVHNASAGRLRLVQTGRSEYMVMPLDAKTEALTSDLMCVVTLLCSEGFQGLLINIITGPVVA